MKKIKEIYRRGCLHCPGSEDLLPLSTVLYNGFGGYSVWRNGKFYFAADPSKDISWDKFPRLRRFENIARKIGGHWKVVLDNPLRGATWRRKEKNKWVLTETNQGFA